MNLSPSLRSGLLEVLRRVPGMELAVVFGSMAEGRAQALSDLDIAVSAGDRALTVEEKTMLIAGLAGCTGRPIDLIDLHEAGEPLLGEVVRQGQRIWGSDAAYGRLLSRHLFEQADFLPYRERILAQRRAAWIGS
ncbi:MAG: type VII toxin-antitoxin system MntA family adenylyltransferase antitoxin [Hylemonella sp.]